jgi:SOS-response transcriptional repressor LexA
MYARNKESQKDDWAGWFGNRKESSFKVKVIDQSMFAPFPAQGYPVGSLAIFEPAIPAADGDDVIIKDCCGNLLFRRLQKNGDRLFLLTINPNWPDPIIEMPDSSVILGFATGYYVDTGK